MGKTRLTIPIPLLNAGQYYLHLIGICLLFIHACYLFKGKNFQRAFQAAGDFEYSKELVSLNIWK